MPVRTTKRVAVLATAGETIVFSATGGDVSVAADSNGSAAWPTDATAAAIEAPGDTYIGDRRGADPDTSYQDLLVTLDQLLQVQFTDTPATTTTTVAPTTTTEAPSLSSTVVAGDTVATSTTIAAPAAPEPPTGAAPERTG